MEIWYKPKPVLNSYKAGMKPHLYNLYFNTFQLDTNTIFHTNENGMYDICKIFQGGIVNINFNRPIFFKDINLSFYINKSYVGFYPEHYSNKIFEDDLNKKFALTYEEAIIKSLLE